MNANELAKQLTETLRQEALDYIAKEQSNVLDLADDLVQALLDNEINTLVLESIPVFLSNPSAEQIAAREAILKRRDQALQLVLDAELKNAQRVKELKKGVIETVGQVASKVGGVLLSALPGLLAKKD